MSIYIVKVNHIGWAVNEILRYTQTHIQTDTDPVTLLQGFKITETVSKSLFLPFECQLRDLQLIENHHILLLLIQSYPQTDYFLFQSV